MKTIQPYVPYFLIAAAAVAGLYFFWYKPIKDKRDAANAAEQAAYDAQLLKDDPLFDKLRNISPNAAGQSAATNQVLSNLL